MLGSLAFAGVVAHTRGYLFRNDGAAYFMLTRSLVLDHDADLTDEFAELDARLAPGSEVLMAVRESARWLPGTGRLVLPWPLGVGVVMAPFYAAGYAAEWLRARLAGGAPDSYGLVPQYFYALGAWAYGLLGGWATWLCCLWALRPAGRPLAATATTAATAASLAVILGGPVVFYVLLHPTM
ncbi:MAG: hypothetical protein M3O15_14150, partial [Acidobacteriota bacterium]|nr:hypothetical protein [Acidobacteriota bacterium]